ncbi:DUF4145 domain-containing protein [Pseudomonas sp. IT-196MI5]|uniref:DUF4145 domain-containing protein n=1 Tax=Pseudomonas sp. IT-196MI5 TaxID=3026440 RepID=UPI0039E1B6AC
MSSHWMPAWKCPICKSGHTVLVRDSLVSHESTTSKNSRGHEAWDPDWIELIFVAWGKCSNERCGQDFSISGTGGLEEFWNDEEGRDWDERYYPKMCIPMPEVFDLPTKCPELVKKELTSAFSLLWTSRESCAGRIRVALELLMDHVKVPKQADTKDGKRYDLKLHRRVEIFTEANPAVGAQLMALKWLGNAGSHDGDVVLQDLLDAFEILEHTLDEIINERSARVAHLAAKLTSRHTPSK